MRNIVNSLAYLSYYINIHKIRKVCKGHKKMACFVLLAPLKRVRRDYVCML